MPKVISDYQKIQMKTAIIESTSKIICTKKGFKNITVDDITHSMSIGKGSFYTYFNSKEECLYDTIKKAENELFEQFQIIISKDISKREKIIMFLQQAYLSESNIVRYISPTDIQSLLLKLPPEFSKAEKEKSNNYITIFMKSFNLGRVQMETVGALLDCFGYINTLTTISQQSKDEALSTIITTIVDYIE